MAPEIVEAIIDGRQPAELHLDDLLKGFPLDWATAALRSAIVDPSHKGHDGPPLIAGSAEQAICHGVQSTDIFTVESTYGGPEGLHAFIESESPGS